MHTFEIDTILHIYTDPLLGDKLIISNVFADAEIYLLGGNVTHFQPKGEEKIIFDGKQSAIFPSKSAHFGVPVCWPWFGPHPTDSSKAQHGFARNMHWDIVETKVLPQGETFVKLQLSENETTLSLFPHSFKLTLTFTIGKTLHMSLLTQNTSNKPMQLTQALHSYIYVKDVKDMQVKGLENISYLDQLDKHKMKQSPAPIEIQAELDRIYIDTDKTCHVTDPLLKRNIIIKKDYSHSTVVWNPGEKNTLHDIGKEKYHQFVCVETANVRDDMISIEPNKSYTLIQEIYCESLDI